MTSSLIASAMLRDPLYHIECLTAPSDTKYLISSVVKHRTRIKKRGPCHPARTPDPTLPARRSVQPPRPRVAHAPTAAVRRDGGDRAPCTRARSLGRGLGVARPRGGTSNSRQS